MSTKKIARTTKTAKPKIATTKPRPTSLYGVKPPVFKGLRNNTQLRGVVSLVQTDKTPRSFWVMAEEPSVLRMNGATVRMEITHCHRPVRLFADPDTAILLGIMASLGASRDNQQAKDEAAWKLEASKPNATTSSATK